MSRAYLLALAICLPSLLSASDGKPHKHRSQTLPETRGSEHREAREYRFVPINVPTTGVFQPLDINNRGVVSGLSFEADGDIKSWIWKDGTATQWTKPGEAISLLSNVTNNGVQYGNWGTSTVQHAGFYDPNRRRWVQLPDIAGKTLNILGRATENGDAVGVACTGQLPANTDCVAWTWNGVRYSFTSYPGAVGIFPGAVSASGEETGYINFTDVSRAYSRDRRGNIELLQIPGSVASQAYDLNDSGVIVGGTQNDPTFQSFPIPFLYKNGRIAVLPSYPAGTLSVYMSVNDEGDLVGFCLDPQWQAFVAFKK